MSPSRSSGQIRPKKKNKMKMMMSIMKKKMMIILLQNFSLSTELGDEFVTRPVKIEAEFEMFEKLTKGNIVRFIILFHILN